MAPISPQAISIPSWIIIGIVISVIGIVILLLTATTLWIIAEDIWHEVLKDRPRYLKREELRKEWNKAALVEEERQFSAICVIIDRVERQGKSEEIFSLLLELTVMTYFPARRYRHHPIINILRCWRLWDRIKYKLFKRGYFAYRVIDMNEWNEALARARGEINIHLEEYASMWDLIPPPYALVT